MEGNPEYNLHPNKIRQLRMEKGLTQQELAFVLGHSMSSLSRLESGKKLPSLQTVIKLEAALQRPLRDIYPHLFDRVYDPVARRRALLFNRRPFSA